MTSTKGDLGIDKLRCRGPLGEVDVNARQDLIILHPFASA